MSRRKQKENGVKYQVIVLGIVALLAGCARFQLQPISPEKAAAAFVARSLTNADL
jgi:hypothetical protein